VSSPPTAPERVPLAHIPTPLEEAPRLSEALGVPGVRILVKRDDQTGLALGGNKARKLEYLVADARRRGCDVLIAAGGRQSNFVRMTAAAAVRCGMECHIVVGGREPAHYSGNLVLDRLLGAHMHFAGSSDWEVLEAEAQRLAAEIGPRAYAMPIGGATPIGAFAYVAAAAELMRQVERAPDWVVLAAGSGGTHAGLLAGLPATVRILGVDVARPPLELTQRIAALARETADLAGRAAPTGEVMIADHVGPAYGAVTDECRHAARLAARTEALVLDPVYTGKAMAGLIAAVQSGRIGGTIVFWHTGGAPALFADKYGEF